MTIDEMIEVLQAYKAGKKIQFKTKLHERWSDFAVETGPSWPFDCYDYRVKPEPREVWVNDYNGVLSDLCSLSRRGAQELCAGDPRPIQVRFIEDTGAQ